MAYIKHDKDNNAVDPQPASTTVNQFSGDEGWSTVTYKNWNGDFVARNYNNTSRTPGTYQARNTNNTARTPAAYKRHNTFCLPIEETTNLLQYASELDNAAWTKFNVSVTANDIQSPEETLTADKLVENTSTNYHRIRQSISSGVTTTFSIFAKAGGRTKIELGTADDNIIARFNLAAGTIEVDNSGSNPDPTISFGQDGWYRCAITATFTTNGPYILLRNEIREFYAGDGSSGVYLWGAHLAGS
jgi:hypothetical protein